MGWWRRQPLRTQLVLLVVLLGALALVAAGVAATTSLRTYLQGQIDQQLLQVTRSDSAPGIRAWHPPDDHDERGPGGGPPGEFYSAVVTPGGQAEVLSRPYDSGTPDLAAVSSLDPGRPTTVPGTDGSWRVIAVPSAAGSLLVGKPLTEVDRTVTRLTLLETVIGALVLALLAVAAFVAVRRSLRPLAEVEQTATAIAGGDMGHRVPQYPASTEVGQLGTAFNAMLDEIDRSIAQRDTALAESRQSEERMRQFVADASHELRTPLTAIRGYSELYRQGAISDPDVSATFSRVEGEAQRMGALVDDLLLLARLDQQRPLERHEVDVLQVASDTVHGAQAASPERTIRLRSVGSAVPLVLGDDARLRQVAANVIGNGVKYSSGDVQVTVDTRSRAWVLLSVADHGPGIPDDEKERVFERFYRGDPSRTRDAAGAVSGAGLGLSIVAAIVAAHGGVAAVRDNDGGGAIVDVWLPAADQAK